MKREAFGDYNPSICFIFFIMAIVISMFFLHPLFTILSAICGLIYYFLIKGLSGLKLVGGILVLLVVITAINPLFNTQGKYVLFYIFGRAYTIESLLYGFTLGNMVICVLIWFACYNAVMSSEKFIYIFGKLLPSVSLILSMVLRLIPTFKKKSAQIVSARGAIGMAGNASMSKKEKVYNGAVVMGALANWALEGGIVSADSMRARGYGTAKRTSYLKYRFDIKNVILLIFMLVFIVITLLSAANGATAATFTPDFSIAWFGNRYTSIGLCAYAAFLLIPSFLNIKELITWRILRSRI